MSKKKKKKKKSLPPRRKRMRREGRLCNARSTNWVQSYSGNNLVKGYARWYGVDELCALTELRLLGADISSVQEEKSKNAVAQRAAANARRKEKKRLEKERLEEELRDYDDQYAFIAGYTSGGAAFGVTWEEYE